MTYPKQFKNKEELINHIKLEFSKHVKKMGLKANIFNVNDFTENKSIAGLITNQPVTLHGLSFTLHGLQKPLEDYNDLDEILNLWMSNQTQLKKANPKHMPAVYATIHATQEIKPKKRNVRKINGITPIGGADGFAYIASQNDLDEWVRRRIYGSVLMANKVPREEQKEYTERDTFKRHHKDVPLFYTGTVPTEFPVIISKHMTFARITHENTCGGAFTPYQPETTVLDTDELPAELATDFIKRVKEGMAMSGTGLQDTPVGGGWFVGDIYSVPAKIMEGFCADLTYIKEQAKQKA